MKEQIKEIINEKIHLLCNDSKFTVINKERIEYIYRKKEDIFNEIKKEYPDYINYIEDIRLIANITINNSYEITEFGYVYTDLNTGNKENFNLKEIEIMEDNKTFKLLNETFNNKLIEYQEYINNITDSMDIEVIFYKIKDIFDTCAKESYFNIDMYNDIKDYDIKVIGDDEVVYHVQYDNIYMETITLEMVPLTNELNNISFNNLENFISDIQ